MIGATTLTLAGNLTADPDFRFLDSGSAVANFTVAHNARVQDRATGEWRDGAPLYLPCTVWQRPAEHVTQSLHRGDRVIVHGRLHQRSYETKSGERRTVIEMTVDEIGVSLRYATAAITKPGLSEGDGAVAPAPPSTADAPQDATPSVPVPAP